MTTTQPPTTALAVVNPANVPIALRVFGEERLLVLKEQIGRGWRQPMTDAELEHIALVCQRTRLDPLSTPRQIHFIQRYDTASRKYVMTPQTGIDGMRLIAARTREYLGQVGPEWSADGETWRGVWLSDEPPAAARVGVLRKGFSQPIYSVAVWARAAQWQDEYDRGGNKTGSKKLSSFWEKMGPEMLAKSAEFNALKRAFPEETNDLELQAQAEERRLATPEQNVQTYDRIFGADEDHTFHDLPPVTTPAGHLVDAATGEVLEEAPAPSPSDLWQVNRQLVARAQELGIQGVPTLNSRTPSSGIAEANEALRERIANIELDQKLDAEQKAF